MSKINILELQEKQKNKNNNKIKYYDNILNKCYNRIKFVSDKSQECCFYEIPEFVFGIPLFNSKECIKYVITNLIENNFIVIYTEPNLLFISWQVELTTKQNINNNKQLLINYLNNSSFSNNQSMPLLTNKEYNNNNNNNILRIENNVNNVNNVNNGNHSYKMISDYKPSGKFLEKFNLKI